MFLDAHSSPVVPGSAGDPTAALASLHYSLAGSRILELLRDAWDRAGDAAKRDLSERILCWAGANVERLRLGDLATAALTRLMREDRFVVSAEQERRLVDLLYERMVEVLQKKGWDHSQSEMIRFALTQAAKQRLGEIGAEFAHSALAGEPDGEAR